MRRQRLALLSLVLVLAMGLAACGSDDDSDASDASSTTVAQPATVNVTMAEYAFSVSGTLKQGGEIRLKNGGDQVHMMGLGKLKDGVTVQQLKDAMAKADPNSQEDPTKDLITEEIGWPGGFVPPGHEVTVSAADLTPGHYGMICFLPTEGGGPPHFAQGMINELDVVAGSSVAAKPDATYNVTVGKPIDGPSTLTAGKHTIELTGTGDLSKQEPQLVQADSADQTPDQLNDIINKSFAGFDSESGPAKGAGLDVAKHIVFTGFDFNSAKSVTFTYDFKPGTYFLAAPDTDVEGADAKPPTEIIKITVT